MKKLLLLIVFTITATLSVYAAEFNVNIIDDDNEDNTFSLEEENNYGFYKGDHLESKIISSGKMYVVIHNPTELAINVMQQGAKDYCKQTSGNNFTSSFIKLLGYYSAYFSCEMENKFYQYGLNDEEIKCIEGRNYMSKDCLELNEKNVDIINAIELQEINEAKYKTNDFIFSRISPIYDKIEEFKQAAEDKKIRAEYKRKDKINQLKIQEKINLFSSPQNVYFNQLKIEQNTEICKSYNFEEGSELFGKCILSLIEMDELY